jgi:Regulator of ribonuclease activity B
VANISIYQLEQMFANMKNKSGWNTSGELLWGYFFTDPQPQKLEPLAAHLVELGYRFVSIYETDDRSTHFLHVERIEAHTPASLFSLNTQMNALAMKFAVASYDGMDVGPVTKAGHKVQ